MKLAGSFFLIACKIFCAAFLIFNNSHAKQKSFKSQTNLANVKLIHNIEESDCNLNLTDFKDQIFEKLEQTSSMRLETICMMKCLDEIHYSRKKVKNINYKQAIEEYIAQIDRMKMIFLRPEVDEFLKLLAPSMDIFLAGGSLSQGFAIYDAFRNKLKSRIKWIFNLLNTEELNLYRNDTFLSDREKENWVRTKRECDELWVKRITFELINEILFFDYTTTVKDSSEIEKIIDKLKAFLTCPMVEQYDLSQINRQIFIDDSDYDVCSSFINNPEDIDLYNSDNNVKKTLNSNNDKSNTTCEVNSTSEIQHKTQEESAKHNTTKDMLTDDIGNDNNRAENYHTQKQPESYIFKKIRVAYEHKHRPLLQNRYVYNRNCLDRVTKNKLEFSSYNELVKKAINNIKKRYNNILKNVAQLEPTIIQEHFINSVSKMFDPHTIFMSAETVDELRVSLHNSFAGIGIYFGEENNSFVIKELLPGGPAYKSKAIEVGDKIIAIQQENESEAIDISGMLMNKVFKLIRGKKGTKVTITLQPSKGDISSQKKVVLIRDEIELTDSRASAKIFSVQATSSKNDYKLKNNIAELDSDDIYTDKVKLIITNEGDLNANYNTLKIAADTFTNNINGEMNSSENKLYKIGVITLPMFYGEAGEGKHATSSDDVEELIRKLNSQHIDGLILDLRNNSGGILEEAVKIGGLFIGKGPMVQVRGQFDNVDYIYSKDDEPLWTGPMVVLVSKLSASASEILAGDLADYKRAIIVGDETTHGKGTVQALLPMEHLFPKFKTKDKLGAAKVTIQKWYLPCGKSTQMKGIKSDIKFQSFDSLLPIGERDVPHALAWDEIDPVCMPNTKATLNESIVNSVKTLSEQRQKSEPEFKLLNERVLHLKRLVDKKEYILNLSIRRKDIKKTEEFDAIVGKQLKNFEKLSYHYDDVKLPHVHDRTSAVSTNLDRQFDKKFDTHLHETIRITRDLINTITYSDN